MRQVINKDSTSATQRQQRTSVDTAAGAQQLVHGRQQVART
jgi:hypothetical protein